MSQSNSLIERITFVDHLTFESTAIQVFNWQYTHNTIYKDYVNALGKNPRDVNSISQIPFLPISFFKSHEIKTGIWTNETVFESSGTTGAVSSRHYVKDEDYYLRGCRASFEKEYGGLAQYQFLALLPSYLERGNSGLISMVNDFIRNAQEGSGFYLDELDLLYAHLTSAKKRETPTILWGVTFALLDFAAKYQIDFPNLVVMETGGMKGRRKEMIRADVHTKLKAAFGVSAIHSEYGMTELFSQAYAKRGGFSPLPVL